MEWKKSLFCVFEFIFYFFFSFFHFTIYFGLFVESMIGLWIRQNLSWYLIFWVKSVALLEDVFASVMWNYINVSIKKTVQNSKLEAFPFLGGDQSSVSGKGKEKERKCHSSDLVESSRGKNECGNWNGRSDGERKDRSQPNHWEHPSAQNKRGLNRRYLTEWTGLRSQTPLSPGCHWCARRQTVEHRRSVQSAARNPYCEPLTGTREEAAQHPVRLTAMSVGGSKWSETSWLLPSDWWQNSTQIAQWQWSLIFLIIKRGEGSGVNVGVGLYQPHYTVIWP